MREVFSDLPLWTLLIWGVFVLAISVFYYRKKNWMAEISRWQRISLITFRTLGLFLLGILFAGFLIKGIQKEISKPMVISVLDNSSSMLNYADSTMVKKQSLDYLKEAKQQFSKDFQHLSFTLTDAIKDIDSLRFDEQSTNLSHVLNNIYNNFYGRNIGAIVLLSDGNFNAGVSPLMIAEKFKRTPIYTLSVGDTVQKSDHLVKSILVNEIAFLHNRFPVEVSIEGNKTNNQSFTVELIKDGKIIATQHLQHQESDYSLMKTNFQVDADAVGIHEYTVKISALYNEYNLENNEKSFFIEVLDDRSKVLLVYEALNPDVGAIKNALISENNLEIEVVAVEDLPETLDDYDLLLWFDPGVSQNRSHFNQLNSYKKSVWYFVTPQTSKSDLAQLQLQANMNITRRTDDVGATFNSAFNLFKLSPETIKIINNLPPLKAHYGTVKYGNLSSILAFQKVGNIAKTDPLIYFGNRQDHKFCVVYGIGLWGWKLAGYQNNDSHSAFDELIKKTVQYLILKENTSRLRIQLPSISNSDKEMNIQAIFYNESYEPITFPTIHFEMKNSNDKQFDYEFLPLNEEYHLNIGRLPQGRYEWKASTEYNGKMFSKTGSFAVKDLKLEKQDTKANHQLLQQMAINSGGEMLNLSQYQKVIHQILERDDIVPIAYESSSYQKLLEDLIVLIIIISLFTAEWGLRKYLGGY